MRIVKDLDAPRPCLQTEDAGDAVEQPRLRLGFGQAAAESLAGVDQCMIDERALLTALGNENLDAPSGAGAKGLGGRGLSS